MAEDLMSEGWRGPFDAGMGPYPTEEGRLGGGGFIDGPLAVSADSNYGNKGMAVWEAPIGMDHEKLVGPIGAVGDHSGDYFMGQVEGWDAAYLSSRRPDWE